LIKQRSIASFATQNVARTSKSALHRLDKGTDQTTFASLFGITRSDFFDNSAILFLALTKKDVLSMKKKASRP
jgi:hypothetical protein